LIITASTASAAVGHRWSAAFGDVVDQTATSIAIDGDGGVVVLGHFSGTVDFGGGTLVCPGPSDATYLARFDASGGHVWSRSLGDSIDLGTNKLSVDAAGNTLVALEFRGSVDLGAGPLTTVGFRDGLIAKYDTAGALVWARNFGGPSALVMVDAAGIDGAGNLIVAGTFTGDIDFGGTWLTYQPFTTNMFLVKFDTDGDHRWSQRFTGSGLVITAVAGDASGYAVVAGYHSSTFDFGGGPLDADLYDIFVARYSPAGAHVWSQSFGEPGTYQQAYDVGTDAAGGVYLTGHFDSSLDLGGGDLVSAGGWDMFVARLESDGSHAWSRRFGDLNTQRSYSLAVDGGGVTIAGHFMGSVDFGGGALAADPLDFALARFDSEGDHRWSRRLDIYNLGMNNGKPYAIAAASNAAGDLACTGSFQQSIDCGGGDLSAAGSWDTFVARYGAVVSGVDDVPPVASSLRAFPNPFNPRTTLAFSLREAAAVTLTIYDVTGRAVRTLVRERLSAGDHAIQWDGRDQAGGSVASGVYFARLTRSGTRGGSVTRRLILLK
jgi:hypothetical protein